MPGRIPDQIPAMALFNKDHFRFPGYPQVYQTTQEPRTGSEEVVVHAKAKNGQTRTFRMPKNTLVELMETN